MRPHRLLLASLPLALVGLALPVVTPVWAAPRPVTPTVRTVPVTGVDAAAWRGAPAALDPDALARAHRGEVGPSTAGAPTRVPADRRPGLLTPELPQAPFRVAGVTLPAGLDPAGLVVQIRVREQTGTTGRWTDWMALDRHGGAEPGSRDADRAAGRLATEPLASSSATAVQVRVDSTTGQAVPAATILLIDPGRAPADDLAATRPAARAGASTTAPAYITRAQWGADESLRPCGAPTYVATIKVGFVHHTVSTNSYTAADSAGIVRGIYAYHLNGNGWCDIGYNFLVDRFGQTFEGRFGGAQLAVMGAHTGGFNTDSFAVSAIGNYETVTPPAALLSSIGKVLGWKLGLHGRDPLGTTQLVSGGGSYTKWPAGQVVNFTVVSGHRDAGYTDCPGRYLYAQLGALRQQANSYRMANTSRDEDLYGALLTDPATSTVQVRAAGASTAYQSRLLDVATQWSQKDPQDWRILIGSLSGDTRPDLIGLHLRNTASGRVELRVATWASGYQSSEILDRPLPLGTHAPDDPFQFAIGGPTGGDLYVIRTRDGQTGRVEVHALSAASGYTTWILHSASALPAGRYVAATSRLLIGRTGDLYLVLHGATGSGRAELHRLSAASRYTTFTLHRALPVGYTDDSWAQWLLGTADEPDLFLVLLSGGGSLRQEVHRLGAAGGWASFTQHAATDLPMAGFPLWQVGMG